MPGQLVKTIRPNNSDPIPALRSPHHMGKIMMRFVGLLAVAVVMMAFAWNR